MSIGQLWSRVTSPPADEGLVGPAVERWRLRSSVYLLVALFAAGALPVFVATGQVALVMACGVSAAGFLGGYLMAQRGRRRLAAWLAIMPLCACLFFNTYNFGTGLFESAYFVALTLAFLVLQREDRRTLLGIVVVIVVVGATGALGPFGEAPAALSPAESAALRALTVVLVGAALALVLSYFTRISAKVGTLERQLDESEAANRAKSVFLAHMSHELRTPMNGVLGMLSVLERTPMSAEQRDFLRTARGSGQSLLDILNDILDLSRVEAGKLTLESVPIDLRTLVEDVARQTAVQAADKDIDIVVSFPSTAPRRVVGDPARLRQILVNLAMNAVKFTPSGHVELRADGELRPDDRAQIVLSVVDTGIGIDDADQARIFERFWQVETSEARSYGGVGLGLSIVKLMVERMGGTLALRSSPGQGSEFRVVVELPLDRSPPAPEVAVDLEGVRILLVEPLLVAKRALLERLGAWGARVEPCSSVAMALGRVRGGAADGHQPIILTSAPPTDEERTLAGDAPIVWMTRSYRAPDDATASPSGAVAQLGKPLRRDELAAALMLALHRSAGPTAAAPRPSLAPAVASSPAGGTSRRVLVVEDNPINQKVAVHMLSQLHCTVDVAESGQDALDMLEAASSPYDLILMDIQMPGMDGVATTAAIRSQEPPAGPHVPIVAVTAHAMVGDRQRFLDSGMDDYLSKPVRREDLAGVLRRVCGA